MRTVHPETDPGHSANNEAKCHLLSTKRGAFQSDNPLSISSVCGGQSDSWDTYILNQDCEGGWSSCNCDDGGVGSQTFAVTRSASGRGAACTGDGSSTTYVEYTGTIACPNEPRPPDDGKNPNIETGDRLSACKDACDNHTSGQCNGFVYDTQANKCFLKTFRTPFDLSKCQTNPGDLKWSTYVAEARLEDGFQQSCACAAEADDDADCVGAWGDWGVCSAACGTG